MIRISLFPQMNRSMFFIFLFLVLSVFPAALYAKSQFYNLGNEQIDFKIGQTYKPKKTDTRKLVRVNQLKLKMLKQYKELWVSMDSLFGSQDIEYVSVDSSELGKVAYKALRIYFKKSSWGKVRKATKENKGENLAVVKNNKEAIFVPYIQKEIDESVQFDLVTDGEIGVITKGFKKIGQPDLAKRDMSYVQFLSDWINNSKSDLNAKWDLAKAFLREPVKNCPKAERLFQESIDSGYSLKSLPSDLGKCYMSTEDYSNAVAVWEKSDDTIENRISISEALHANGENEKALDILGKTLNEFKKFPGEMNEFMKRDMKKIKDKIKSIKKDGK